MQLSGRTQYHQIPNNKGLRIRVRGQNNLMRTSVSKENCYSATQCNSLKQFLIRWLLVIHVPCSRCSLGTLPDCLELNDRTTGQLPQLNILWFVQLVWPFDSQPVQSVIPLKLLCGQASADWKQWIIRPPFLSILHSSAILLPSIKMSVFSLWPCSLNSFPHSLSCCHLSIYLSNPHAFPPSSFLTHRWPWETVVI